MNDNYESDILALFNRKFSVHFVSDQYSDEDVFLYDCIVKIAEKLHTDFGLAYSDIVGAVTDLVSLL